MSVESKKTNAGQASYVFLKLTDGIDALDESPALLRAENLGEVVEFKNEIDIEVLQKLGTPLIAATRIDQIDQTKKLAEYIHLFHKILAGKKFSFVIFTTNQNEKFIHILRKLGQLEPISKSAKAKSYKLKLQQAMKNITPTAQQSQVRESITELPPVEVADDCWILSKQSDLRRVRNVWMVELVGPGSSAGKWTKIRQDGDESETEWAWVPALAENDPFVPEKGIWTFFGKKPELSHRKWIFVSPKPIFSYRKTLESPPLCRFQGDARTQKLEFGKNSNSAIAKMPAIKASLSDEVVKSKNAEEDKTQLKIVRKKAGSEEPDENEAVFESEVQKRLEAGSVFVAQEDPVVIRGHFSEGKKVRALLTVWTPDQSKKYDFKLEIPESKIAEIGTAEKAIEAFRLAQLSPEETASLLEIAQDSEANYLFHFATPLKGIFFSREKSELLLKDDDLRASIPKRVFEITDELLIRHPPKKDVQLRLREGVQFSVRDLSVSEVSVYVDETQYEDLTRGRYFEYSTLVMPGLNLEARVIVTWRQKLGSSRYGVGFEWVHLSEVDRKTLKSFFEY